MKFALAIGRDALSQPDIKLAFKRVRVGKVVHRFVDLFHGSVELRAFSRIWASCGGHSWVLAAVLLIAAPLMAVGLLKVSKAECFTLIGDDVCRVNTTKKLVALTFDDGPTQQGVDTVLPLLDRYHAKATFFLIGERVTAPLVYRIVTAGHEIGNHSFKHYRTVVRSSSFYDEEIR